MSEIKCLGIVAIVIAVVYLSLKVISWCSKYAQYVKKPFDGRARLLQVAITLQYEAGKVSDLVAGRKSAKLKASKKLAHAMGDIKAQLCELESLLANKASSNGHSRRKWLKVLPYIWIASPRLC
jgi:uncharacterized membrane protein YwzB